MKKPFEELINDSKHFCVLPWVHFHAWPNGNVMPCCVADSSQPVSKIKSDESIVQMMNSEDYKKLRVAMLNDERVEVCRRCYDIENIGTWTMRQSHNKRRGMTYKDIVEATNEDGSIDEFKLKYMDIRFSNICNMKCRSCGPGCSSLWSQEVIETQGSDHLMKFFGTDKMVVNSNEDQIFMKKLLPYLVDVQEVYFAGGEIVITPEHYECLDYWIEHGVNETIELTYTTNLSVLKYKDKDLIKYWKKFPKLKIWASLDAEGETAEILRKGSDWKKIISNIKKIKEELPHAEFQITPTISIWNVFNFYKLFDFLVNENLIDMDVNSTKWYSGPRFNLLTHPWYANIMILPRYIKDRLWHLYKPYHDKYDNEHFNGFKTILYNLEIGDEHAASSPDGIRQFKEFNDRIDGLRGERLVDIVPEIQEVYNSLERKVIEIKPKDKYLAVTWQVNNFCNYKCSYCNPGNYSGTDRNEEWPIEIYLKNLSTIINRYKQAGYVDFKFFFSGGEPTAWRNFIPICQWLRKELPNCTLAVNTNLSRPLAWWQKYYHLFDDIVASFHVEFADKEKYKQNSIFLCDKVNYLSTKLLMHEERFWEVVDYGTELKKVMPNYVIEWTPLFDEMSINAGPWEYKDPEKKLFIEQHNLEMNFTIPKPQREPTSVSFTHYSDGFVEPTNSNTIIVNRENFFKGWKCNIGDSIFINPVGEVTYASCGQDKFRGHILTDIDRVGPKEIICGKEHCHCGTDIIIPKVKFVK
jgi:organic radical activating enzyme